MENKDSEYIVDADIIDDELQPWQRLQNVCHKWAVMSQHEKVHDEYARKSQFLLQ